MSQALASFSFINTRSSFSTVIDKDIPLVVAIGLHWLKQTR